MGIVSLVLGLLVAAFVAVIVVAQIRSEARTKRRQERDRDHDERQKEPSHERAKDREWWRARTLCPGFPGHLRRLKAGGTSGRLAPEGGDTRPEVMMRRFGPFWLQRWSAIVGVLLSLALVACGSRTNANRSVITATLGTFSGRPNPTWELEDEEVGALRDIVNSLPAADEAFDAAGLPAYAGFHVEAERGTITGEARYLDVYAGVVLLLDDDLERLGQLEDPEYEVETFLFETAERHVGPAVYDQAFDRFRKLKTGEEPAIMGMPPMLRQYLSEKEKHSMSHKPGAPHTIVVLLVLASLLGLLTPIGTASADVGPKPSMDFEFVYETEEPLSIVDGKQMQCEEPDCTDAESLEEVGPNRFWCTGDHCSSSSYGYTTYNQLVVQFSDGVTRTSGVFSGGTMKNEYRVTVREDGLEVERVKRGVGLPRVWVWVGRLVGPAFAIPLGLLILMGGLLYLLDAWGRE